MRYSSIAIIQMISVLLILKFSIPGILQAQEKPVTDLSEFLIAIEVENDDLLKLTCREGCAWVELTFSCPVGGCEQSINRFGMTSIQQEEAVQSDDKESHFMITFQRDSEKVLLACKAGCAWKELEFNTPLGGEFQAVNQTGMTSFRP